MSPDVSNPAYRAVTYKDVYKAYKEQVEALIDSGVDLILFETTFDTLNVKAGLEAAETALKEKGKDLPIMLSLTLSAQGGRTLSGQTLGAFLASVQHINLVSIGLNCSFGAADMKPYLAELAKLLNCSTDFLMGLTDDIRPVLLQEEPEDSVEALEEETASADSWDDISEVLDQAAAPEEPARRIRWEDRGRIPPEGRLILTYQLTNDGPAYRPALWDGSKFRSPDGRKELTGLQYTHWLEVPTPGSGETFQAAPPELAEGQLAICGWMPGGTFPREPCEVVADFCVGGENHIRQVCIYDQGNFYFRAKGSNGAEIEAEIIRWMWLPPIEENR